MSVREYPDIVHLIILKTILIHLFLNSSESVSIFSRELIVII